LYAFSACRNAVPARSVGSEVPEAYDIVSTTTGSDQRQVARAWELPAMLSFLEGRKNRLSSAYCYTICLMNRPLDFA
jgi:hypothetical protein